MKYINVLQKNHDLNRIIETFINANFDPEIIATDRNSRKIKLGTRFVWTNFEELDSFVAFGLMIKNNYRASYL